MVIRYNISGDPQNPQRGKRCMLGPCKCVKPIFQCNAKPFALGTFASPNPRIPTCWYFFALGDANFSRHPTQNPNASQWNIGCVGFQTQNSCVGHVHFILFVSISFALGSQRKHIFSVEYGLKTLVLNFIRNPLPSLSEILGRPNTLWRLPPGICRDM